MAHQEHRDRKARNCRSCSRQQIREVRMGMQERSRRNRGIDEVDCVREPRYELSRLRAWGTLDWSTEDTWR